jgi:hypothetical protein
MKLVVRGRGWEGEKDLTNQQTNKQKNPKHISNSIIFMIYMP